METEETVTESASALSQLEVERLLNEVQEGGEGENGDSGSPHGFPRRSVSKHDFRGPAFLSKNELRSLRIHHEDFIRALSTRLSIYLRMDMDLQISKLQTVTYREFVDSLPYVSHLTLYKCEPLEGICILDIAPRLGLAIVDRLMGGPGRSAEDDRDMSDIELALLDQAVNVLLSEWCNHWDELREHRPTIIGHEQHGRFLHTASPKSVILMLAMEARFGDCVEQIQFAFPYDELEPMVRRLRAEMDGTQKKETGKDELQSRWKSQLDSIPVKVVADFPGVEITARELTQLTVGEVLPLDAACPRQIRVSLAGKPKYLGQLGAKGDSRAIMLTRPYDS